MRKTTKLLTLVLAALMIVSSVVTTASAAFTDVPVDNKPLHEAVELLSTLGVIKGTTETTFAPDELVNRQQMAAFIYRLMKAGKQVTGGANTTKFTDLKDSTFFYMVSWAAESGIIKGTSATTFNPEGSITLQDAYVMIARALGYEKNETLSYPFGFIDVAEDKGLDEDLPSTVNYTDALTRGNVAIILANAFYADMNETTVEYKWIRNGDDPTAPGYQEAYVAKETTETVAHKIFGVEEEKFFVAATEHYGYQRDALHTETNDIDRVFGYRFDADGKTLTAEPTREFEMKELGLEGKSDDYFLAELTLFVKKDDDKAADDKVLAAKSNLVKKTVKPDQVVLETSAKTDAEYYVTGVKNSDNDKVMTGYATFDGLGAYLDINQAPYSFTKDYEGYNNVAYDLYFIDLTAGSYDEKDSTFRFEDVADANALFAGKYAKKTLPSGKESYEGLTTAFQAKFPEIYNKGLYELEVYDIQGDGYADLVFVKDYKFFQVIDKKNKDFAGLKGDYPKYINTEDATIKGSYKSEDYVLGYVNEAAKYAEIIEVIAPVTDMVTGKSKTNKSLVNTLKNGTKIEFYDADKKLANYNGYDYNTLTSGKTYELYIKDGVLLYKSGLSSGNFDADADYAIVTVYDKDETKTVYVPGSSDIAVDQIVYQATGVQNGEFVTYLYVNAIIDGAVKAVKLADYAYTHYNYEDKIFSENAIVDGLVEVSSQKITDAKVAESVMYHDFLDKFATYTVDADGSYSFSALDISSDYTKIFADTEEEDSVVYYETSAVMKHYTGSIYNISGLAGISRFALKDYSKVIIKTVNDDGDDVYTVYTQANLPKFDTTTFKNVKAIFVNNKSGSIENLGIMYAEIDEFGSKETEDYRIVTAVSETVNDSNKKKTVVNLLNPVDNTVASNVDVVTGFAPNNGFIVALNEDGKVEATALKSAYADGQLFTAKFAEYDEFLTVEGDSNAYVINDKTTILVYRGVNDHNLVAAADADDVLAKGEDNTELELAEGEVPYLWIIAEDNNDKSSDEALKNVKMIIAAKSATALKASK